MALSQADTRVTCVTGLRWNICRQIGAIDAAVLNAGANPYNDWDNADWNVSF
jgi:hypothetical protein